MSRNTVLGTALFAVLFSAFFVGPLIHALVTPAPSLPPCGAVETEFPCQAQ